MEKRKNKKNVLLKDNLNDILVSFDMNFTNEGKNILKKASSDERMINYNNLFFKTGDPNIKNFDFLKRFSTLHDLLIDLLNKEININTAAKEMIITLEEPRDFILLEEKGIANKNTQSIINKTKKKTKEKIVLQNKKEF